MGTTTYTSIYNRVKALCGIPAPDANAQTQITEYINRRAKLAYEATDFWPRWLVVGELRTYTPSTNIIPFTQATKSTIGKFIRIHKNYQPFLLNSSTEYEFYVTSLGAAVMGDGNVTSGSAYVTYKKDWDGPYTTEATNIPDEWEDYIAHGAYADWLRADGKNDVAAAEEGFAQNLLDSELSGVDVVRSSGIVAQRISTHLNRSYRL